MGFHLVAVLLTPLTRQHLLPIIVAMRSGPLRILLVVLALFGVFSQTVVYAMAPAVPDAEATSAAKQPMDCAEMAATDDHHPSQSMPCTGISLECIAKMGCIVSPVLASQPILAETQAAYSRVVYALAGEFRSGLSIEPELFPPITLD